MCSTKTYSVVRFREFFQGNSLKARLIRGGLGSAVIQAANRLLALALGIVLARTLGPDGYGVYAYAFAIMGLLMVAAEAGVPTLLMREVAASQGKGEWGVLSGALRRGFQFVALTATTVSLLGLLVLWWFAESLQPVILATTALMLLVLPVSALCKTVAAAMQGLHRVVVGQAVDLLIRPLLVLIIVAVVFMTWPEQREPYVAMAAQLLGALVVLFIGVLVLRRFLPYESRTAAPEYKSRQWLKSALPFTLIGGAGIINSQADIIMIGWFMASEDVGIYRVAVQGATLVAFGLQAASAVVAPQFSRLYAQGDMEKLQRLVTSSARVIFVATLPLVVALVIAGGVIVGQVFGSEYVSAHLPLAILAVGQLALVVLGLTGPLVSMTGFEGAVSTAMWVSALVNIVLNFFLIPSFGLNGAAVATVSTVLGWHVFLFILSKEKLGIIVLPFRIQRT